MMNRSYDSFLGNERFLLSQGAALGRSKMTGQSDQFLLPIPTHPSAELHLSTKYKEHGILHERYRHGLQVTLLVLVRSSGTAFF